MDSYNSVLSAKWDKARLLLESREWDLFKLSGPCAETQCMLHSGHVRSHRYGNFSLRGAYKQRIKSIKELIEVREKELMELVGVKCSNSSDLCSLYKGHFGSCKAPPKHQRRLERMRALKLGESAVAGVEPPL